MGYPTARHSAANRDDTASVTRRHRPDYWLVVITIILLSIGLILVYSIGPALAATRGGAANSFVSRQFVAVLLGAAAFFITSRIPLKMWRRWQWALLLLAMLGTLIALVTPVIPAYPAHRWIRLGSFSLQSVEALKFALVIATAGFLALQAKRGELANNRTTLYPMLIVLGGLGLVVAGIQSDLGSMGVIVAMLGAMAYVAGLPLKRIIIIGLIAATGTVLLISSTPYRRARLATYLEPAAHCQTSGYQACQALIAIGSGGIAGLGLGQGAQAYGYLPEAQNDSIFAIYAEKFGFIGTMMLISLFVVLFARMRTIVERAPTLFSRLVVVGILAWLSTQTIINIGAMIGLLPLKGITLPLVSYGGTSVLFVGAALGLVFQISHYTSFTSRISQRKGEGHESDNDRRRIGRTYNADPRSRLRA